MKSNKKIVHVVPAYPPSVGGMEHRVFDLVTKLHALDFPLEVFTSDLNALPGDTVENGVVVHRLKKIPFIQTPISFKLIWKLLFVKVDIFHIHLAQPFFPVIASLIAVLRRKPYIIHVRAIVDSDNFFGKILISLYINIALRFVFIFADKIIVLTESYIDILTKYGVSRESIVVIPNATDFKVSLEPKSLAENGPYINLLANGRVDHQKNYHFMFRCLALLKAKGVHFRLSIVSKGRMQDELEKYAVTLGITENIIWLGRVYGEELENVYAQADIFLHTALFEGFATVLIEAMAKGLPICATRVLGVKDVVKHDYNGLLSAFNEEEFVANLQKVIQDKDLYRAFSQNNLISVGQYKWTNIIDATTAIYSSL